MQVQEALTSGACEGSNSYETMELLGDSVLNFVGGVHMYIDFPSCTSEKLHTYRHDLVSNKSLYRCGLACGLPEYIFAELLNTKTWVPPGPALEDLPQKSASRDESSEDMVVMNSDINDYNFLISLNFFPLGNCFEVALYNSRHY